MKTVNLYPEQIAALDLINEFLCGPDSVFILRGYAGTGKTTLVKFLCDRLAEDKKSFHLYAPTGRAAMVLKHKTGYTASTIHRGIYNINELEERKEGDSFKFYYKLALNQDSIGCIYIVDESSMISDVYSEDEFFAFGSGRLLRDLITYIDPLSSGRKIIFVGDDAQLPPVNMNYSPALDVNYLIGLTEGAVKSYTLTDVYRQEEGSGILSLATSLRESIRQCVYNHFDVGHNGKDIRMIYPEYVGSEYLEGKLAENQIMIVHSNRQALNYNRLIRQQLFNWFDDVPQSGDVLINTKNNYNAKVELFNGMFVKVLEVGGISYSPTIRFKAIRKKTEERALVFRDILVELQLPDGTKHELRTTLLDNFLCQETGRLDPLDQQALYVDAKTRLAERGIRPGTELFKDAIRNDPYFNALQAKYGYAITCHKAQGGEWQRAFVDFNVSMGRMTSSYFRWVYTAVTRASQYLICIDPPNYNALSEFVVEDIQRLSSSPPDAVYVPDKEGDELYFVQVRRDRIQELAMIQKIDISIREMNYQLEVRFERDGIVALCRIWYKAKGFTKVTWDRTGTVEFQDELNVLLEDSLKPSQVPFEPRFPFQRDLHTYFSDLLYEEGIVITNIVQREWSDRYYLKTDAECAAIEFFFNKKHIYTKASPFSTLSSSDVQLQTLVHRLRTGQNGTNF